MPPIINNMTILIRERDMEIQTTVQDFSEKVRELGLPPNAFIKITLSDFTDNKVRKKSRWAKAAERIRSENHLKGRSEEVNKLFRQFRDGFSF
jgi:hypothetical protein